MNKNDKQFLLNLKEYGQKNDIPNISLVNAKFLYDLVIISKPKNILEIGTANGFSTINFALAIKEIKSKNLSYDGKITTIEFSPHSHEEAKKNFEKAKIEDFIKPILGNAIDIIPILEGKFDFVFIDGMKKRTRDFLDLTREKTNSNGIIVIDDVIKFHDKMSSLFDYLAEKNISYNTIPIDFDDGIIMIIKP